MAPPPALFHGVWVMGTPIDDKTEPTTKLTKQGVRDLNRLTPSKVPVTSETISPVDDAPAANEPVSVPIES